ncbi:MAG: PspC domain-containing protein, partial [Acidimicrobiales bacterium]
MTHWFPIESPGGGSALRRSGDARIAGVSGGLEARLGIDRNIIRVAFVLLALAGGAGFAVYLGAWILMPAEGTASPARPTVAVVVGAGLLAIGAILALVTIGGIEPLGVVILGLAFAGITVLNRRPRPQPSSPIGPDPLADPALAADSPPPYPFIPPPTLVVPPPPSPPP